MPIFAKSKCIYLFECTCGSRYIGRSNRHLGCHAREHIPAWLINKKPGKPQSAITRHLLKSGHNVNQKESFKILNRQKSPWLLKLAEASNIRRLKPNLCVQKEFVTPLRLPWGWASLELHSNGTQRDQIYWLWLNPSTYVAIKQLMRCHRNCIMISNPVLLLSIYKFILRNNVFIIFQLLVLVCQSPDGLNKQLRKQ